MASTPSLAQSDHSSMAASSPPATPADLSPDIGGQTYSIPQIDSILLPDGASTPQSVMHARLPDIMDPATAATVPVKRICCIGAGYVGGPTAAVIALHNPNVQVTVVDRDEARISSWRSKHLPIHEPGLVEVVRTARDGTFVRRSRLPGIPQSDTALEPGRRPNLFFSTLCAQSIAQADMVLISVNTPTKTRGLGAGRATDMTALEGAVRDIATHARPGTILVEKSTVPCKTGQLIKDILEAYRPGIVFPVLSNPEFLSEGTAVRDLMQPSRVIIGCESTISGHRAAASLTNIYAAWVPRSKITPSNIWSSELCKLAANAMLAQRISSINSISAICERTGADVNEVAKSIGSDPRIGAQFLKAGLGFGGSCFRKDIASLTYLAESLGLPEVAAYWQQVLTMNDFQRDRFAKIVIACLNNTLRGKKITLLGFAFKKNTGDARESPALDVIRLLLQENPRTIAIFDPLCSEVDIRRELSVLKDDDDSTNPDGVIEIVADPYVACAESNAVLVLTDWDMFKNTASVPPSKPELTPDCYENVSPTDLLDLKRNSSTKNFPLSKPPTPPDTPILTSMSTDLTEIPCPEPPCPSDCRECKDDVGCDKAGTRAITAPLNWERISNSVKEPRWVFDGRNILDAHVMTGLGFRLETLGRASLY